MLVILQSSSEGSRTRRLTLRANQVAKVGRSEWADFSFSDDPSMAEISRDYPQIAALAEGVVEDNYEQPTIKLIALDWKNGTLAGILACESNASDLRFDGDKSRARQSPRGQHRHGRSRRPDLPGLPRHQHLAHRGQHLPRR